MDNSAQISQQSTETVPSSVLTYNSCAQTSLNLHHGFILRRPFMMLSEVPFNIFSLKFNPWYCSNSNANTESSCLDNHVVFKDKITSNKLICTAGKKTLELKAQIPSESQIPSTDKKIVSISPERSLVSTRDESIQVSMSPDISVSYSGEGSSEMITVSTRIKLNQKKEPSHFPSEKTETGPSLETDAMNRMSSRYSGCGDSYTEEAFSKWLQSTGHSNCTPQYLTREKYAKRLPVLKVKKERDSNDQSAFDTFGPIKTNELQKKTVFDTKLRKTTYSHDTSSDHISVERLQQNKINLNYQVKNYQDLTNFQNRMQTEYKSLNFLKTQRVEEPSLHTASGIQLKTEWKVPSDDNDVIRRVSEHLLDENSNCNYQILKFPVLKVMKTNGPLNMDKLSKCSQLTEQLADKTELNISSEKDSHINEMLKKKSSTDNNSENTNMSLEDYFLVRIPIVVKKTISKDEESIEENNEHVFIVDENAVVPVSEMKNSSISGESFQLEQSQDFNWSDGALNSFNGIFAILNKIKNIEEELNMQTMIHRQKLYKSRVDLLENSLASLSTKLLNQEPQQNCRGGSLSKDSRCSAKESVETITKCSEKITKVPSFSKSKLMSMTDDDFAEYLHMDPNRLLTFSQNILGPLMELKELKSIGSKSQPRKGTTEKPFSERIIGDNIEKSNELKCIMNVTIKESSISEEKFNKNHQ